MKIQIPNGAVCLVKIRGQQRQQRRVFKWMETRYESIPCYVFTAPCRADVRATWDEAKQSLTLTGRRTPASEVSVPEYDLIACEILP